MKILLVCPFYPPEGEIAALRIAEFAKHWARAGHSVHVLTREPLSTGTTPPEHTNIAITRVQDPLKRFSRDHSAQAQADSAPAGAVSRLRQRLMRFGKSFIIPDIFVAWAFRALRSHPRRAQEYDVVVASGGPLSAILLGERLARRAGATFVVDFRDPVASNPMNPRGRLRTSIDTLLERRAVRHADVACTVGPSLASQLSEFHSRPIDVVMNGYDEETTLSPAPDTDATVLRIVYAGRIYPNNTEYRAVFLAARAINSAPSGFRVELHYFGRSSADFRDMAESCGADTYVVDHGEVSHDTSIAEQSRADLLLLLLWNDPRAVGVLGGKLFEYIGARRPILMLGYQKGDAAAIVREGAFGLASNSAEEIEGYLRGLAREKQQGAISALTAARALEFTREIQSRTLLEKIQRTRDSL
ncbi:MAG: glycosyltransferase [Microbacterium sp.]|jgi:glycosyltransferase involved in cell wall biosynthesis|uniref:glycosyltransferase n=1 Tax=Microbacterium sp. TaxID=51671 RepID=UPI0028395D3C|nr:glycosyltransferase [Microbacterium sp.]MDR2322316.1 glycosyltransferase [Microbacterium sp.]